ncbi:MAG: hypothetical protein IPP85_03390 [Propionivibrio sp.]|nr:hypothetical protein [Propionivibrio sp.]
MRYQAALRPEEARILQTDPGKVNCAARFVAQRVFVALFYWLWRIFSHSGGVCIRTWRRQVAQGAGYDTIPPDMPTKAWNFIDSLRGSAISDIKSPFCKNEWMVSEHA